MPISHTKILRQAEQLIAPFSRQTLLIEGKKTLNSLPNILTQYLAAHISVRVKNGQNANIANKK